MKIKRMFSFVLTLLLAAGLFGGMAFAAGGFADVPDGAYICACGPEVMLRAANAKAAEGQYSFEARMACGFGACMGCSMHVKDGYKRVCKDGPVIGKEELAW